MRARVRSFDAALIQSPRRALSRRDVLALAAAAPPALWLSACGSATKSPEAAGTASYVRIYIEGDRRIAESNDLPDHPTGDFPNAHCPFPILPQRFRFEMAASAVPAAAPTPVDAWLFGVAVNGVVFEPGGPWFYDGNVKTGYRFDVLSPVAKPYLGLDENDAHCQPGGEYHYHGVPAGLLEELEGSVVLLGYAADGFPIYGPHGYSDPADPESAVRVLASSHRLKSGRRPEQIPGGAYDGTFCEDYEFVEGAGDLDECNGRYGVTPEYPGGTYHYCITYEYPYVPRLWRGTPDKSFAHPSPGPDAVPPPLREYRGT